jgi:hypothetical protein
MYIWEGWAEGFSLLAVPPQYLTESLHVLGFEASTLLCNLCNDLNEI